VGFALFAGAVTMFLLALQWGGVAYAWSSSTVVGLFVGAGLAFALFVPWQLRRGEAALVPPRLFAVNRNPALLCAAAFFVNGPFQIVIYWLPIWFQGVQGASPVRSGVDYFPTVIADVVASFVGAGVVMQLGWWNPFILAAEALVCLGGGLLSTLYPDISSGHWIGYQIFGGVGYSLASNLSHLAMQSSLPQDLVPIGSSTLLAIISTSCAIFMAIGQTVFQKRLEVNLGAVVPENTVQAIINGGATNVASLVSATQLPAVVQQYSKSITQVFVSQTRIMYPALVLTPGNILLMGNNATVHPGVRTHPLLSFYSWVQVDFLQEQEGPSWQGNQRRRGCSFRVVIPLYNIGSSVVFSRQVIH
jgi:hypothetical protein